MPVETMQLPKSTQSTSEYTMMFDVTGRRMEKKNSSRSIVIAPALALVLILSLVASFRHAWHVGTSQASARRVVMAVLQNASNCPTASHCSITLGQIAQQVADVELGIPQGDVSLELEFNTGHVSCATMSQCMGSNLTWQQAAGSSHARLLSATVKTQYRSVLPFASPNTASFTAVADNNGVTFAN